MTDGDSRSGGTTRPRSSDRGFGNDVDASVLGSVTVETGDATVDIGSVGDLYFNSAGDGAADVLVALGIRGSSRANLLDFKPMPDELRDDQRLVVAEDARTADGVPDAVRDYFASPLSDGQFATSGTDGVSPVLPVAGERVDVGEDAAWIVGGENGAVRGDAGGALVVDDRALAVGVTDEAAETVRQSLADDIAVVGTLTDETLAVEQPATRLVDAVDREAVEEIDLADTRATLSFEDDRFVATVDHRKTNGTAVFVADPGGVTVHNSAEVDAAAGEERANAAGVDFVRSDVDPEGERVSASRTNTL